MSSKGGSGKMFSSEYQPANRGRKKGSKNRKNLLETMLGLKISSNNLALVQIKNEFPDLLKDESGEQVENITIEQAIFFRLIRQAIMDAKPLPYIKEIFDRLDGKSTIIVQKEDEAPVIDPDERAKVLAQKTKEALEDKERRDNEQ